MKVSELVMNLFEVDKKYEITIFDPDNGFFEYKCFVDVKTEENLYMNVFEPSEIGGHWIHWTDVDAVEEIE
ncbi:MULTISPECIES: hypothetical protein [Bacillus cereus group]|uniref:hypothetical protein n=1 Tax=Bacillus cereus group TaxID=86661 RepID=UPI0010BEE252|nr:MULTISPECIES: hypothetical protein [Bacillus cereus group]MDR4903082.1 hypothetical protein [Bacillus mycoides]TKI26584.1 hypothetical protein FC700_30500 [Bacillus mycoides]